MSLVSVPNPVISNTGTSDVTMLTANDNAIVSGLTDGTKDITVNAVTATSVTNSGAATCTTLTTSTGLSTIGGSGGLKVSSGITYTDKHAYTTGAETLFTAAVNSVHLVSTQPANYSGTDNRWGTWLVQAISTAKVIITSIAVGSDTGGGATPTLTNTGLDIILTNGSGSPTTTVYWLRLA